MLAWPYLPGLACGLLLPRLSPSPILSTRATGWSPSLLSLALSPLPVLGSLQNTLFLFFV